MKRKVFAGSAVAAALLFQLTAVGFPAYAAEYDAVQKEEFVSSFSDAETKQVAQYLVDNGLSLEESKDLMKTYEKGLAIIARESENSGIAMYDLEDSADEEIHIDAPFYSETNLASTDHYIAVINTNVDRNVRGCLDFLFHEKYSYYDNEVLYFLNNDTNISKLLPIYEDSDLSLTYKLIDVISDEPMEWVNEGYNDTFNAYLVTSDGTISLATESTDTSKWVRITDVNLPDGDNTTYHTGKIKVTYNISALRGKNVKLVFVVKDSGDNTYDTAAVVDNVTLTK